MNNPTKEQTIVNTYSSFIKALFGLNYYEDLTENYKKVIEKIKLHAKEFKDFDIQVVVETRLKNKVKNEDGKTVVKIEKKISKYNILNLYEKGKQFPQNTKSIKFVFKPVYYDKKKHAYYPIPNVGDIDEISIEIGNRPTKETKSKMLFEMQDIQNFSNIISFKGLKKEEDLIF